MNKITYFIIAIILMLSSASALEKKDCTGLKKLSKAFIACKSGNLKAGIINTGSSIKDGTVGKIKKLKANKDKKPKIKKVKANKDKKPKIKLTKQYPKGIKK